MIGNAGHHVAAAILTIIVLALSLTSVWSDSATSDEPAYIAAGMIKLQHGRLDFFRDQPPLMNSITAVPLIAAGYRMPPIWEIGGNHWAIGKRLLYISGYDARRMLLLARLPTIALFVALCWTVYAFVLQQTGSGFAALFALALTGFCPNLMGHGRLATVDVPAAFFCFAATAAFIRLLQQPSMMAALVAGIASGAAVLTKTSSNLLGPYFLLLFGVALLARLSPHRRRAIAMSAVAALVAAGVIWIVISALGSAEYRKASFPDVPRIVVPFAEYLANIRAIHGWYSRGSNNPQFLLGEFSNQGWWHYYPTAMLLKMTLPVLALIAIAIGLAARNRRISFAAAACLLFALLFLSIAAAGELALGIRYILPVFPFVFAAVAMIFSTAPRKLAAAALVLLVLHVVENLRTWPSYLSYFNPLIGSHRNADRYLIDSNLDWGQDLRRLDGWLRSRGIDELAIHYFGGGVPQFELGARVIGGYGAGGRPLPKGWFALSRHLYRSSFSPAVARENYDHYLARSGAEYVATVGGSIDVYRVE